MHPLGDVALWRDNAQCRTRLATRHGRRIPERGHFRIRAILEEDLLPRVRRGADSVNSTDTSNQENQSLGNRPLQPSKSLTEQNQGLDAHVSEDFTDLTRRQNLTH